MSKFVRNIAVFLASLPLLVSRAHADVVPGVAVLDVPEPEGVPLRPLNDDSDNPFAGHSSHASHASHSSHYSGSGGGGGYVSPAPAPYVPYVPPSPAAAPASSNLYGPPVPTLGPAVTTAPATGEAKAATGNVGGATAGLAPMPSLSEAERLRLQIMRVQIRLTSLGLYDGRIDGVRNPATIQALKQFQLVKGLPDTGMMTTPTMNALGVRAN